MFYFELKVDFPQWQIGDITFTEAGEGVVANSLHFVHGQGDTIIATRVKIYGLPEEENVTSTDIADACYSNGGDFVGTLDDDVIIGLNITAYKHNVTDEETSFAFTFDANIQSNLDLYYETGLEDDSSKLATIRFCVMMELLRPNGTDDVAVVNYAEFAFGYNATLDGTIVLADAFEIQPADPTTGGIEDDTFTVQARVCGPDGFVAGDILNQGDSVHICINSTSYPEASISGIDTLSYIAPLTGGGNVVLDAVSNGVAVDLLTKFDADKDCDGNECIVKTQLQGNFYPSNGFMNVTITGKATMELGGRRILAKVVRGDRSLQEGTSQSGFSMDVETAAFETSGTTKKGVTTSIIMTIVTAAFLRFF